MSNTLQLLTPEFQLNELVVDHEKSLEAYVNVIDTHVKVDETNAIAHCYSIALDGSGRPRVKDLAEYLKNKAFDYCIPRSQKRKAENNLLETKSAVEYAKLVAKAQSLFTNLKNSGEGGEMLLYILIETVLNAPQLICKMSLKTNSKLHFNGCDGIHAKYDKENQKMILYWGESKLYSDLNDAISHCITSLKEFFESEGGSEARQNRDIELVTDFWDLGDTDLQNALVDYFDPTLPKYNNTEYQGVCLIGFDSEHYPDEPNQISTEQLSELVRGAFESWRSNFAGKVLNHQAFSKFVLNVFFVPFPSVEVFRKSLIDELNV